MTVNNQTPSSDYVGQNTSGTGSSAIVPPEIKGWNWGAFFLGWIWGIGNSTWIAFLTFIPVFNIIWAFFLGAKGNKWAWQNKKWDSIEHFKSTQRNWNIAGIILFAISIVAAVVAIIVAVVIPLAVCGSA